MSDWTHLAPSVTFVFHGVHVRVCSGSPTVLENLRRDFSFFSASSVVDDPVLIEAHPEPPPWDTLPSVGATLVQPGCAVYDVGEDRFVDYHGEALTRWCHDCESGEVWSEDPARLHEIVYLLILSRVGELHDRRGLHRVHAGGLSVNGQGLLMIMPSGGGKSTLTRALLGRPGVKMLSDDSPLVDTSGSIHPFPTRLGFTHAPTDIDSKHLREFTRSGWPTKWLVDVEAYADRIESSVVPARAVVLGRRMLSGRPTLTRRLALAAAPELFRSMVVGLGLPQLVEYFLRLDPGDLLGKARLTASRTKVAGTLLRKAKVFTLDLSRDSSANAEALLNGVEQELVS